MDAREGIVVAAPIKVYFHGRVESAKARRFHFQALDHVAISMSELSLWPGKGSAESATSWHQTLILSVRSKQQVGIAPLSHRQGCAPAAP